MRLLRIANRIVARVIDEVRPYLSDIVMRHAMGVELIPPGLVTRIELLFTRLASEVVQQVQPQFVSPTRWRKVNATPVYGAEWFNAYIRQSALLICQRYGEVLAIRIKELISAGRTVDEMTNILQAELPALTEWQVQRIVRTETIRLYNYNIIAVEAPIKSVAGWVYDSALDVRTCDICAARDGKLVTKREVAEGEGIPPLHPNCRCSLAPVMLDEVDKYKRLDGTEPPLPKRHRGLVNVDLPANIKASLLQAT